MKYKVVIFDFDGTLADSFPLFLQVAGMLADTYKFRRVEEKEIETLRGYGARQIVRELRVPVWQFPLIARDMRRLTAQHIDRISLFAGVEQMLHELAQAGVTLAIVSSNSFANVCRVLGADNAALISHYECGVSMFGKRSRFRRIRQRSGALPGEILCVGDEIRDWEAATKERLPFGAVAWGFTHIAALEAYQPAEVFRRVAQIAELLSER